MQVVLLERIAKLGQMGDVVNVKDGYARNFLLPEGKALRANKENLERFEKERARLEAKSLKLKSEADAVKEKLDGQSLVIIRQSGETGQLYGSVSTRDIATSLDKNGFAVTRNQIALEAPIKALGVHKIIITLHPEVTAEVGVNVARTQDEAERQARGEDVTVEKVEEEETIAVEEIFEEGVTTNLEDDTESEEIGVKAEEEADTEEADTPHEETQAAPDENKKEDEKPDA